MSYISANTFNIRYLKQVFFMESLCITHYYYLKKSSLSVQNIGFIKYFLTSICCVVLQGSRLLSVEDNNFPCFSVFFLLFSIKFGTELENYQYDSFK